MWLSVVTSHTHANVSQNLISRCVFSLIVFCDQDIEKNISWECTLQPIRHLLHSWSLKTLWWDIFHRLFFWNTNLQKVLIAKDSLCGTCFELQPYLYYDFWIWISKKCVLVPNFCFGIKMSVRRHRQLLHIHSAIRPNQSGNGSWPQDTPPEDAAYLAPLQRDSRLQKSTVA